MKQKILTIPNLLSFFRIVLIPVIIWLYVVKQDYLWTMLVLVLSGVTDVVDGFIARKFNMVSDFGKAFDPVADKLTQIATLFCLVKRFPFMKVPLVTLVVKEVFAGITGLLTIRKSGQVMSAVWHGKVTTFLLYSMMALHIVWFNIPGVVSDITVVICTIMMVLSAVLYGARNIAILRSK